jgi:hypothetical protein
MSSDLRTILNGFDRALLDEQLKKIDKDERYTYYADTIRAFISSDTKGVSEFQQDERFLVAAAASCNPLADLDVLNKNLNKFSLVAALNPSVNQKILSNLQKYEHPSLPIFLAANPATEPEDRVFSVLAYGEVSEVNEDSIDNWYDHSLDQYEESQAQSIAEISQLLTLEILGFFAEGGEFPFWQMLEDTGLEPEDKFWKILGSLPRVPKEIYTETPIAINTLVARELAAEKALSKKLIEELVEDDCQLGVEINNHDSWFVSRSPRASVAFSNSNSELLTRIIQTEIDAIESAESATAYLEGSMSVMWRIAGNPNLKAAHVNLIKEFISRNLVRCSDEMFNYDVLSMLEGGTFVDAPLLNNPSFPPESTREFEMLIAEMGKAVR